MVFWKTSPLLSLFHPINWPTGYVVLHTRQYNTTYLFLRAQVKPAWMSKFHSKKDSTAAQGKKSVALLTCLLLYLLVTQAALEGSFFYGRFLSYLLGSFAYKQHHQWHSVVRWLFSTTPCIFSEMEGPNFYELEPPAAAAVPAPGCCRKRRNGNFRPHTQTYNNSSSQSFQLYLQHTVVVEKCGSGGGGKAKRI